jgi:hypothetical protein
MGFAPQSEDGGTIVSVSPGRSTSDLELGNFGGVVLPAGSPETCSVRSEGWIQSDNLRVDPGSWTGAPGPSPTAIGIARGLSEWTRSCQRVVGGRGGAMAS